jgi:hypothetical protein
MSLRYLATRVKMRNLHKILSADLFYPTKLQHKFVMYSGSSLAPTPTDEGQSNSVDGIEKQSVIPAKIHIYSCKSPFILQTNATPDEAYHVQR